VFLPLCACQTFASACASNLDGILTLFVPLSVESVVAIMELALQCQFHTINKELETLALQNTERERRKGNIRSRGFEGLADRKHASSWSLRAALRFLSRKLDVEWVRKLQNVFGRREMLTRFSKRRVGPVTLRERTRSISAARCRLHHSDRRHVSEVLQNMRLLHGLLCNIASDVNSRYGLEVLVLTAANLCKLVLLLHSFIRDIIVQGDAAPLLTAAMISNCALQLCRILCVCYRCEQVRCEV
jgi:hypothetical protein